MSVGATIDSVTTRVNRAAGQLVSMVVRRRISRETLIRVATELEETARILRTLTKEN